MHILLFILQQNIFVHFYGLFYNIRYTTRMIYCNGKQPLQITTNAFNISRQDNLFIFLAYINSIYLLPLTKETFFYHIIYFISIGNTKISKTRHKSIIDTSRTIALSMQKARCNYRYSMTFIMAIHLCTMTRSCVLDH